MPIRLSKGNGFAKFPKRKKLHYWAVYAEAQFEFLQTVCGHHLIGGRNKDFEIILRDKNDPLLKVLGLSICKVCKTYYD